jgi:hypothetical protein
MSQKRSQSPQAHLESEEDQYRMIEEDLTKKTKEMVPI